MVARPRHGAVPAPAGPDVEVVVPVYNEEADLEASVTRLHAYLSHQLPFSFRITVADNASTDRTWAVARDLAGRLHGVQAVHLEAKGRGRALRQVWAASDAAVLAYMDVDLSTDLAAVLPLVAPLLSGHSDVAIGTRLARGARVVRGTKREVISRAYNLLLHAALRARFSDAQCGFKAIRADRARLLLPLVQDHGWFFDTELLVLAERAGMRIHEVPVDWVDDPDSRVELLPTVRADLLGVARLGRGLLTGRLGLGDLLEAAGTERALQTPPGLVRQVVRFAVIGVLSTAAYVLLYLALRAGLGAQGANAVALLATAVANTAANRRLTFGVRSARHRLRHQVQGLGVFGVGLALTSGALAALGALAPGAGRLPEVAVLVGANVTATVVRFVLLRAWVFAPARVPAAASTPARSSS